MPIMMRPDSGTMSRTANHRDVNKYINELQQEVTRSKAETQRVRDKLNCLISLVRRSWNGDRNASIHLANIIGLDIPPSLLGPGSGTAGRPVSRALAPSRSSEGRAQFNWERLTIRLLQHDNEMRENEIREYQHRYIENRSKFMDEIMHFHQKDMSRVPISRPSSGKLTTIDHQFLDQHSKVMSDGRNENRRPLQRAKSAVTRRPATTKHVVEQAEVKLRDLFVESSSTEAQMASFATSNAHRASAKKESSVSKQPRQDYDNPKRYVPGNLFDAEDMLSRKPRPMSAAVLRERDSQRSRPRSAVTFKEEGAGERPLKYETTRPVSGKKSAASKDRRSSASSIPTSQASAITIAMTPQDRGEEVTDAGAGAHQVLHFPDDLDHDHDLDPGDPGSGRPPISVRVKNAVSRPEGIDRFSDDLRRMEEMEMAFKSNTLALQKRLGLPADGMV